MKITKPISVVEVESEFLKAEWYKDVFNPVRADYDTLVKGKDFINEGNNRIRKSLLWQWRLPLLQRLPFQDIHWYLACPEPNEFDNFLIIKEIGWVTTFGTTKRLEDVAKAIRNGLRDQGVGFDIIDSIKKNIGSHPFEEKLILISTTINGPYTVIEGNHRAVAFQIKLQEDNNDSHLPKEVILGIAPNMNQSPWLNS